MFCNAAGAILRFTATVDIAGVELGTIGVIVGTLVGLLLGLWALWVLLFFIGSR